MGQVLVFEGPRRIAFTDEEVAAPGPGEVLVHTLYSGISAGTELTAYRGTNPYLIKTWDADRRLFTAAPADRPSYPLVGWGYEEVGEVAELGAQVSDLRVGQRRAAPGAGTRSRPCPRRAPCAWAAGSP